MLLDNLVPERQLYVRIHQQEESERSKRDMTR